MKLDSLADVFEAQLKDLYSAEQQLVEALPTIASAATSKQLATAVEAHLDETRGHVEAARARVRVGRHRSPRASTATAWRA